jgi:hypothetical protein
MLHRDLEMIRVLVREHHEALKRDAAGWGRRRHSVQSSHPLRLEHARVLRAEAPAIRRSLREAGEA